MSLRIVRLGTPRLPDEGLRLGTVRRPPRGVKKEDYARRDYYDVWVPELSPSAELVSWLQSEPITEPRWARFVQRYRAEMKDAERDRLLALLTALSRQTDFSVGCYCETEEHCHRSVLRELFREHGAEMAGAETAAG
jgi:uncharacterized protein YeaO (DUF488 family)